MKGMPVLSAARQRGSSSGLGAVTPLSKVNATAHGPQPPHAHPSLDRCGSLRIACDALCRRQCAVQCCIQEAAARAACRLRHHCTCNRTRNCGFNTATGGHGVRSAVGPTLHNLPQCAVPPGCARVMAGCSNNTMLHAASNYTIGKLSNSTTQSL
eukprot:350905-Chlamydomonas_euryale.AAC.3